MTRVSISLAQMNVVLGDTTRNLTTMQKALADAARRKSHMMLLPEMWHTGFDWANYRNQADQINTGVFNTMSELAQKAQVSIVGSLLEKRGDTIANSAAFYASNGRSMGVYRKIHLFPPFDEDRYLQAGGSTLTMDLPWGATSLAICYDLRFPEMFRRYAADEGSELVLLLAQWPAERIEHWRTLIRARAIENQMFIAAVNATGETGDIVFGGHSMIVDPTGEIVVEAGTEPGVYTGEIELDRVKEIRRAFPALDGRRPELF
jgi:omega-amidase